MPDLSRAAAILAIVVLTVLVIRIQRANALANARNVRQWLALGSMITLMLAYVVDPTSLVGLPVSLLLLGFWAAPVIAVAMYRSLRLMTMAEYALNSGDLARAERLIEQAREAVAECASVDQEWNRAQLRDLEERLHRASRISLDSPARSASDSGASIPGVPVDTISPRSL